MKFTLEIELGNEAMQKGTDVANVLWDDVVEVLGGFPWVLEPGSVGGSIFDKNGNRVGRYGVEA